MIRAMRNGRGACPSSWAAARRSPGGCRPVEAIVGSSGRGRKLGDGLKDSLRALLGSLGLLDTLRMVRTSSRYSTLPGLSREIQYRLRGGPDGFPMPPAKLIYSVVGHGLAENYYAAG